MKFTTNNLSLIKHLFGKIIFTSQVIILSTALPILYCVGVSHNAKMSNGFIIIKTNKGKTLIEPAVDNKPILYPTVNSNVGM